jgi:hypothetical protein
MCRRQGFSWGLSYSSETCARLPASKSITGREQPPIYDNPRPGLDKTNINHVKVNFDAAFSKKSGEGSWGVVARSDDGKFVAAAAGKLKNLRDALQAEACVAASEGSGCSRFEPCDFLVWFKDFGFFPREKDLRSIGHQRTSEGSTEYMH